MPDIGLEIRHLDVEGGDATVIIVNDMEKDERLYTMLIDAGAEGHGSVYLDDYLQAHHLTNFDCMIATHYHKDHIEGLSVDNSIRFKKFIDNGGYNEGTSIEGAPNGVGKKINTNGIFNNYIGRIETHINTHKAERTKLPFVNSNKPEEKVPVKITLGRDDISLTCYCANGILGNGLNVLRPQLKVFRNPNGSRSWEEPDPNDLSLAFVLSWGNFRYFTAGDLSGDETKQKYKDLETQLVNYLRASNVFPAGSISVLKASHHGSAHSTKTNLLTLVKPKTIVVSSNQVKQVPHKDFLVPLKTYLDGAGDPEAKVVFSNRLEVKFGDDRYNPLKELQDAQHIVSQNIADDAASESMTNRSVKCVIIRRRVKDGVAVEYDPTAMATEDDPDIVARHSVGGAHAFEIVMTKRDPNEALKISAKVRPSNYSLERTWEFERCKFETIEANFDKQMDGIVTWYKSDAKQKAEMGKTFLSKWYPSFAPLWQEATDEADLRTRIRPLMTKMLQAAFVLKRDGVTCGPAPNATTDLGYMGQQTFFYLMNMNSWQPEYNHALDPHKAIEPNSWWNVQNNEPYDTNKAGGKRVAQEQRKSSRQPQPKKPKT